MKILLFNDYSAPVYGAELQTLALRDGLRRRGHEVQLFSSKVEQVPGVKPEADVTCFGTESRVQALSQAANPSAYLTLRRLLRRFRPDVAHVGMYLWQLSPLILPLLHPIPCVYHARMYKSICPIGTKMLPSGAPCGTPYGGVCLREGCVGLPRWIGSMAQLALVRRWRPVFDRVIAQSTAMRDLLVEGGFTGVDVVPNGLPERPMRPPLSDPPLVAFAGRLVMEKGVDTLLRAFAEVRPAVSASRLLIAGDGPQGASLRELAARLGVADAVEWLGFVSRERLEARFAAAWVQVVPSRWQEPFGNVTAEAMMRGTAVIASKVGAASDILQDERSGLLVPPDDPGALAQAMRRLLQDRDSADRLGRAARESAIASLGEERRLDRILALYNEMLISRRA